MKENPYIKLVGNICSDIKPTTKGNSYYFDLDVPIKSSANSIQVSDRYRIFVFSDQKLLKTLHKHATVFVEGVPRLTYSKETGTRFSVGASNVVVRDMQPSIEDDCPF
jgi:hypothetical protein